VLKRYERVRGLKEKEKWKEGDSVFGLLKLKILKFKLKKEKAAPAAAEGVEGAEAVTAAGQEAQAQPQAGAKSPQGAPAKQAAPKKDAPPKKDKK